MRVLVVGGAGFLGSYVVDEFVTRGHEVSLFDLRPSPYINGSATMMVGDIMDAEAIEAAVKGNDAVYNFAGLADLNNSIDNPVETVNLNVIGNLNVLEACRRQGEKRFKYSEVLALIREMMNNQIDSEMLGQDYRGHYILTPYSLSPTIGVKLVNNPEVDFGQDLSECLNQVHRELQEEVCWMQHRYRRAIANEAAHVL